MLTRTLHAAAGTAAAALLFASLGLAGCSTGSNATVTHTPALKTTGGRATARSGVQSAILVAEFGNGLALPGGPTPASFARRVLAIVHARRTLATGNSTGVCNNGRKTSKVTNADGSVKTTTDLYYEAICTTLESEEVVTIASPSAPSTTGSGTIVTYDKSGAVTSSQVLAITLTAPASGDTQETITLTDTASLTVGGSAVATLGATCVGAPNSATLNCAIAHQGSSAGTTTGEVISDVATAGTAGGNANATLTVTFYIGSLAISQSGTAWGITGASAFNVASGTYGYASTGPSGNGTMTLKDQLYAYTATATLSATGLSVTIIQGDNPNGPGPTPIATATIDVAGTGTLTYADGTSEPIWGGLIGA